MIGNKLPCQNQLDLFGSFDRTPTCDRQADRHRAIATTRASIASRGYKYADDNVSVFQKAADRIRSYAHTFQSAQYYDTYSCACGSNLIAFLFIIQSRQ